MSGPLVSAWLSLQCEMLPHTSQGLVVLGTADPDRLVLDTRWPEGSELDPLLVEAARQALRQGAAVLQSPGGGESSTRVSCPLSLAGRPALAVAFRVDEVAGDPRYQGYLFSRPVPPESLARLLGGAKPQHTL